MNPSVREQNRAAKESGEMQIAYSMRIALPNGQSLVVGTDEHTITREQFESDVGQYFDVMARGLPAPKAEAASPAADEEG